MKTLLEAVATMEGFYKQGTRPRRLNNPGDLEYRGWEGAFNGSIIYDKDKRFAFFSTPKDGFLALAHLFTFPEYMGKTLREVFNTYAPPIENNTNNYLNSVCEMTGLFPSTILTVELLVIPSGV
jgi:hypothetical protein